MKSLAHPDWPYTGTPWEWRGFADDGYAVFSKLVGPHWTEAAKRELWASTHPDAVYQKQNFGPDLK